MPTSADTWDELQMHAADNPRCGVNLCPAADASGRGRAFSGGHTTAKDAVSHLLLVAKERVLSTLTTNRKEF